jgi:GNAT superfamily N-acetyltransferase
MWNESKESDTGGADRDTGVPMDVTYTDDLSGVDWEEMKQALAEDAFDNGRSPEQLRVSFENSYAAVIAHSGGRIIGTARVLSDGICNAYVVDVWTLSAFRRRGVAREMMRRLVEPLRGQHVYLFSDDCAEFYKKVGFRERPVGLEKVVGEWLKNDR